MREKIKNKTNKQKFKKKSFYFNKNKSNPFIITPQKNVVF